MDKKQPNITKVQLAAVALLALFIINISNVFFPVFAGYGGQWARAKGHRAASFGWGDLSFYPQTKLYPWDSIIYISLLLMIILACISLYRNKKWNEFPRLYIVASFLPLAWAAITFSAGFNYSKCNLPSQYFVCVNPTYRITQRLLVHAVTVILTLLLSRWAKNKLFIHKNA